MSYLTEQEIFDCLSTNFQLAAENCLKLAHLPIKGPSYTNLREELHRIEGAARQACAWRADTRWLAISTRAAQAHRLSGGWLRKYRSKNDQAFLKLLFIKLGEFMVFGYNISLNLKNNKTGISGPILPEHMSDRTIKSKNHVPMKISNGGIIIPDGSQI